MKRSSNLNKAYDDAIGPSIDKLSQIKLPQYRQILPQYRPIRGEFHNFSVGNVAKIIADEVVKMWERTIIPHKGLKPVTNSVKDLTEKWTKIRPENRLDEEHQRLDSLFDIKPSNLLSEDSLQNQRRKSASSCWSEEFMFFVGQLEHPQSTNISTTIDLLRKRVDKTKAHRAAKSELYKSNNSFDSEELSSFKNSQRKSANDVISAQQGLIIQSKRKRQNTLEVHASTESETEDENLVDDAWQPSTWHQHTKSTEISLTLPAKKLPTHRNIDNTKIKYSSRAENYSYTSPSWRD